jgi:phosphatidylglycerol:prolipoprotein diacylglycerol transferase
VYSDNAGARAPVPFPHFDPVLVHLGPFAIRWYALAYVAGILLGWRYAAALLRRSSLWTQRPPPMTAVQLDDLILWVTLGVIVGGRVGHTLFYTPELIWRDPLEILRVWHGGMSFHGGALGVLLAISVFAWRNQLDMLRVSDLMAAVTPIGLFFGRIANFINGELWGRPTTVPWGIIFPGAGPLPRHPSQLYEAACEGLGLFALLAWAVWGKKWTNRRGVIMGLFIAGYGVIRISLENVREPDSYMPHFPLGLTMGMMLSTPMVLVGLWLVWRGLTEPLPPAVAASASPPSAGVRKADEPA